MLPFIQVFGHQISMYALCIMAGAVLGILVALFRSKIFLYKKEDVLFASFYGLIGLIVGGKILFFISNASWIIKNFTVIISDIEYMKALMQGGFVFYGGFFGAVAGIVIYARQYKLEAVKLIEIMIPSVPLIHTIGRVGCFCAGCCYGLPMDAPWGVYFSKSEMAPHDEALFPVQLLEAACNLILCFWMLYRYHNKQTKGEAFCFYIFSYGVIRFFLEFLRYDMQRGSLLGMSTSQWVSILLILTAIIVKKRKK